MRLTLLSTMAAVALACGGEKKAETTQAAGTPPPDTSAATGQAVPAASTPAGPVVQVKMTGDGSTKAAFEPSTLTIAPGTTVRFINISGGAHNIVFSADSIPKGALDALNKGLPDQLTDLTGPYVMKPNDTYDVSFAGAPAGVYHGYCQPHMALGMRIQITVK
jgi:plastocyanin